MVFFTRTVSDALSGPHVELALSISENTAQVERLEAQGFVRCSIEAFREAWRKKDAQAFARMRAATQMIHSPQG
jgi:hypothetical protein